MSQTAAQQLCQRLLQARRHNQPLTEAEAHRLAPASFAEAYQVQQSVAEHLGWFAGQSPRFWKLGGGAGEATAAAVPEHQVFFHPDAATPIRFCADDACQFTALEFELTVRLGKTLAPGCTLAEAKAAVSEVYLTLEVCDLRAPNWQALPASYRLADQQMSRGFVLVGEPLSGWHDAALAQIAPRLQQNHRLISEGTLHHPQGHPLASLPWLANLSMALYQQPLLEGSLIATGTWKGMHLLQPGDQFHAQLQGLGQITAGLDGPTTGTDPNGTLNPGTGTTDGTDKIPDGTKTTDSTQTKSTTGTREIRFRPAEKNG